MAQLTEAVYDLARLYLCSFCPVASSFSPAPADGRAAEGRGAREASGTTDHLQFTVFALHGIPAPWISRSDRWGTMVRPESRQRSRMWLDTLTIAWTAVMGITAL